MGVFSWKCPECKAPVMNSFDLPAELDAANLATYIHRDGTRIVGRYDGYGRIVTIDGAVLELPIDFATESHWALYHTGCVPKKLKAPGKNVSAKNQGHWAFTESLEGRALLAKFAPSLKWEDFIAEHNHTRGGEMKNTRSIFCLQGKHGKCSGFSYHSILTGKPVPDKGVCPCACHKPAAEQKEREAA